MCACLVQVAPCLWKCLLAGLDDGHMRPLAVCGSLIILLHIWWLSILYRTVSQYPVACEQRHAQRAVPAAAAIALLPAPDHTLHGAHQATWLSRYVFYYYFTVKFLLQHVTMTGRLFFVRYPSCWQCCSSVLLPRPPRTPCSGSPQRSAGLVTAAPLSLWGSHVSNRCWSQWLVDAWL